jgi:endoglucanase
VATRPTRLLGAVVGLAIVGGAFVLSRTLRDPGGSTDPGREFLRRYVEADGRVVRRDEGGDTVSEGQAYAMLVAVAVDDRSTFDRVWTWTRTHLQRDDGTLSWRWQDGRVVDVQSASDADVDAAHALILAEERFDASDEDYLGEARRIADGILRTEVIPSGHGPVLAAGPWAVERGIVNPSYFDARAFGAFALSFGEERWDEVARAGWTVLERLTDDGARLPSDWAEVTDAKVRPIGTPERTVAPGTYGYDAVRAVIRSAACAGDGRRLAQRWSAAALSRARSAEAHPAFIVAAAAGAHASGDDGERDRLLARAVDRARSAPSYYGWAWAALGPLLLDGSSFGDCT